MPHRMQLLSGLGAIADQYDAILCDVWGVLHNGRAAFEPACEALTRFRAGGGRVVLLTNAPVPSQQVIDYMAPLNVPGEAYDGCVSSGDATRAVLTAYAGKKVWRLGTDEGWEHDRFLYEGLALDFVEAPEAADIGLLIGLRDLRNDHPDDYHSELAELARSGLELICANPDIQVRIGNRLHWCAGALGQIYEQVGGAVIYPGKPHSAIYDLARARVAALSDMGRPLRFLAIGDSPATDMLGANRQGMDGLYVGTGLAEHGTGDFLAQVQPLLDKTGARAKYAQPALVW